MTGAVESDGDGGCCAAGVERGISLAETTRGQSLLGVWGDMAKPKASVELQPQGPWRLIKPKPVVQWGSHGPWSLTKLNPAGPRRPEGPLSRMGVCKKAQGAVHHSREHQ